jgi:hypothetical protein
MPSDGDSFARSKLAAVDSRQLKALVAGVEDGYLLGMSALEVVAVVERDAASHRLLAIRGSNNRQADRGCQSSKHEWQRLADHPKPPYLADRSCDG